MRPPAGTTTNHTAQTQVITVYMPHHVHMYVVTRMQAFVQMQKLVLLEYMPLMQNKHSKQSTYGCVLLPRLWTTCKQSLKRCSRLYCAACTW